MTRPQRPRHPLRRRRPRRDLVARAQVVLERQLWIAVLEAQRDLGVDVPDGVVEAYEDVVDEVDLDSIAARERVTRHDVKARIEEFSALAGHEHIHKGMTSRDLTENVEQLQVRAVARAGPRPRRSPPWPGWPGSPPSTTTLVMAGRSPQRRRPGHHARQAVRHRRRRAAGRATSGSRTCSRATRCAASRARWAPPQDMLDLLDGDAGKLAELEQRVAAHLGFERVLDQRRPGLPALARLRRASSALVQLAAGPSNLATTIRLMAGNELVTEGFQPRARSARRRCRTR